MSRKKQIQKQYLFDITPATAIRELDTSLLFEKNYVEPALSPIDQFIENTNKINLILANHPLPFPDAMGSLILLGYMSAVESYLRALFRGIINIDEVARKRVESLSVTFAAAIHHTIPLMPEALLESTSLSSKYNILKCAEDLLWITNLTDKDLQKALDEFAKIVEIRHCCVHRFGKLGSQNAQRLGLDDHSILLEKPFQPDLNSLSQISTSIRSIVHAINSTIFKKLMERIAKKDAKRPYSFTLTWNLTKDKKYFKPYYDLFASQGATGAPANLNSAYQQFKAVYK